MNQQEHQEISNILLRAAVRVATKGARSNDLATREASVSVAGNLLCGAKKVIADEHRRYG